MCGDEHAHDWAATQVIMGDLYRDRIRGDKAENIEGAKTAGWHGIRFIDAAQLERDLAKYGITV